MAKLEDLKVNVEVLNAGEIRALEEKAYDRGLNFGIALSVAAVAVSAVLFLVMIKLS